MVRRLEKTLDLACPIDGFRIGKDWTWERRLGPLYLPTAWTIPRDFPFGFGNTLSLGNENGSRLRILPGIRHP
jgi:hypothetical protein